jgi:hypothetical protein
MDDHEPLGFCLQLTQFLLFTGSISLEIQLSTKALELELSDMEGLEDPTVIEYIKSKFDKDKD